MRLLLDTNILIWVMSEPDKLTKQAQTEIEHANELYVSSVSIWEMSIKSGLGKLKVNFDDVFAFLEDMKIEELPITWEHSRMVRDLPFHHHDPFDRMLIAQSVSEPVVLLTSDKLLAKYSELVKIV